MVFSGKPSTGCQMCRTRRIKCDEAKPSCNQCLRTSRTCPGYKSQIDLLFRNETGASAAEKRARTAARKKSAPSSAAGPSTQPDTGENDRIPPSSSQSQAPALPVSAPTSSAMAASQAAVQSASFSSFSLSDPISTSSSVSASASAFASKQTSASASKSSKPSKPSSIPMPSSRKAAKPRKPLTEASRKSAAVNNSRAAAASTAPSSAPVPPVPPASTNTTNLSNDSKVRIEGLNAAGCYNAYLMPDTLAKASMGNAVTHQQPLDYEYSVLRFAGRNSITAGFVESTEVTDQDSPSTQLVRGDRHAKAGHAQVIIPALSPPPVDLAINHFFSNFVQVPYQNSRRGYLDFIIPLIKKGNNPTATAVAGLGAFVDHAAPSTVDIAKSHNEGALALAYAFRSCAFASMATRVASDRYPFMDKALSAYTRALAATTFALRDPELCCTDSTLAAVLLLGFFESITAKKLGLFAWGSHIEGAIGILKARGLQQRTTPIGRGLFIAVRTQMIIYSLATGKVPGMGTDWWFADTVHDSQAAHCQRLSIYAAELRSEATACLERVSQCMAQKPPEVMAEVRKLADRAYELDRACVAWMENLSPEWNYHAVAWQADLPAGADYSTADVFPGDIDVYPDHYIVGCWNMMRSTRLCITSIGVRCAAWACWPADYRATPEYAAAASISRNMIRGIIASVPFYLGYQSRYSPLGRGGADTGWTWVGTHKHSTVHVPSSASSDSASPEAGLPTPPRDSASPPANAPAWQVDPVIQGQPSSAAGTGTDTGAQPACSIPTTTAMPPTAHPHSAYSTSVPIYDHASLPPKAASPPAAAASPSSSSSSSGGGRQPRAGHKACKPLSPPLAGFMLGDDTELKGLSGYFLAWPLTNIATQDYTTDEQRAWVVGRLRYISEAMGVRYAGFLSGIKFRAPSMLIARDRAIAEQALLAATGQLGKGKSKSDPVSGAFADQLGLSDKASPRPSDD